MSGSKCGVDAQIQAKESYVVLTHCYEHALNLAVGDTIKHSKLCHDLMDAAFEINTNLFDSLQNEMLHLTVIRLKYLQMRKDILWGSGYSVQLDGL